MPTVGKGPCSEAYLQSLDGVACSVGVVDHGFWLRFAQQFLSYALVRRDVLPPLQGHCIIHVLGKTLVMAPFCDPN